MSHVDEANFHINALLNASKETLAFIHPNKRIRLKNALDESEHLMPKRDLYIRSWSTALDIVRYALEGDTNKVRQYSELLLEKLEEDEQEVIAKYLFNILEGEKGQQIYLAKG